MCKAYFYYIADPGLDMKKPDTFCNQLFEIFHKIPQIVKQLADSTDPQTRNTNWKSIKCIIRQQNPNFARSGILDRPESKNCFQKFIRRRKRHSTYINFRNRKKKFNNNLAKRNAPDDSRFKNIIDFIIKNKSFRSNYTYVPVLFATVKSVDLNQLETSEISSVTDGSSTENLSLQTSSSSASKSTNMSSTNSLLMSSTNTISGITTVKTDNTESMKPTISEGSTSTIIHSDSSAGGSATATSTLLPAMKEAKNLTEELSFRIPRLRESFQDIMDLMKDEPIAKRMKKEISDSASTTNVAEGNSIGSTRKNDTTPSSPPSNSTVPITTTVISTVNPESINPSISSTEHVPFPSESHFNFTISDKSSTKVIDKLELKLPFSGTDMKTMIANGSVCATKLSNVTSSFPIDGNVIPGVLIYPINSETLNNKSKRGIQEEEEYSAENKLGGEYSAENNLGINYYFTIDEPNLNANKKYIDFNPLPKLKKDVLNDCQNETEEMLNVLKSLNMKVPDEIENSKDKFGPDLTNSTSNIVPNTTETASITELSTETTNVMDFNSLSGINISSLMETNPIPNVIKPVANINKMKLFNSSNVETTIDIDAWCATSIGVANEIIPSITIPSRSAKTTTPSSTDTFSTIISSETPEISTKSETSIIPETSPLPETSKTSTTFSISTPILNGELVKEVHKPSLQQKNTADKLRQLETDLKLVNEVQNILNGMNGAKHEMKKRELSSDQTDCTTENNPIFELNFKVVSDNPESNKDKEINELGKILQLKAKTEKCRRRRLSKFQRKRMKKKKQKNKRKQKPHRIHRFLGQRIQNCM
ncbi:unnamed protein product [Phaedon cochleariae]|uniref:Uncharacterized protein n=1 Tax=Phaedon cochleariae TaxID=80249 RepID=A0A9P0GM81_PHACE|nr:unnamed protein product [Phaedon cochleariae]